MKVFLLLVICFWEGISDVSGLTCLSCDSSGYFQGGTTANDDCYDNPTGADTSVSITPNITATGQYCYIEVLLSDGLVTTIRRGSRNGNSDSDRTTTGIPPSRQCTTTYNFKYGDTETTTCFHACNTDNCNIQTTSNYKACSTNCSESESRGYCDYFSGSCACNAGYTGPNCNSAVSKTYRSCVQCNSETTSNCESLDVATQCPFDADASSVYCSSSRTTLYNSGAAVLTSVTKGCVVKSPGTPNVQCAFTGVADTQFTGYGEYTCTATCNSDGCNSAIPEGNSALECVQCTDPTDSGCATRTTRYPCPTGSNQCYSKVVYFTANKTNHKITEDPDYTFSSIERSCRSSNSSVRRCTTVNLGAVDKVTCEESCSTAGCNVGWPNRPRCSRCISGHSSYDSCTFNPPEAIACPKPFESFCVIEESYKEGTVRNAPQYDGYTRSMSRGCSYHNLGNTCVDNIVDGVTFKQCKKTCTTHGCNQGSGAVKPLQSVTVFILATLIGHLVQQVLA